MVYIKRADLVAELQQLNVKFDEKLTVPELRALLQDHQVLKSMKSQTLISGLSSMTNAEMVQRCSDHCIAVGTNDTKSKVESRIRQYHREQTLPADYE